jgi:hypothetical protein
MGGVEMEEIASIIKEVLDATKPEILAEGTNAGKPSKRILQLILLCKRNKKQECLNYSKNTPCIRI